MRTFISFLVGLITAAVVVGLGVLIAQNGQSEEFSFMGAPFQGAMGWLTAGAVAVGFLLAFLVLIPGRLASAWQSWTLGRRGQELEARLRELRQQHAELQGSHRNLVEEHQRVMSQVLTPAAASRVQPSFVTPDAPAAAAPRTSAIILPPAARPPADRTKLPPQQRAPIDRLREQIAAMRVALAAKVAELRRAATRNRTPNSTDQGKTPPGPVAASS